MNQRIQKIVARFSAKNIAAGRRAVLESLTDFIQKKRDARVPVRLNFICTHNSRRSHLAQIWAQTMAFYFKIEGVECFSGGTEATAMFPKIASTLKKQGFEIEKLSAGRNPVHAVRFDPNAPAVICFSKVYDHFFNPKSGFAAVMTCGSADENCPVVFGADARFAVKFDDPKAFDGTPEQTKKYAERSLEIAQEMWFVFSKIR